MTKASPTDRKNWARPSHYLPPLSYYCESGAQWLFGLLVLAITACGSETTEPTPSASTAAPAVRTQQPEALQAQAPALLDSSAPTDSDALTVLVFGDSISAAYGIDREEGWATLLQQRLRQFYPGAAVINASVSGETTQGGRARLEAALLRHSPDVVFLELGGNDALRGYPIARLRENLQAMAEMAHRAGARVILLGMQIPPNYGPQYTREFAATFETVAEATGSYLVPFFLDGVALVEGMIQGDGIHPTSSAQPILLDAGWRALVATMGDDYPSLRSATTGTASRPSEGD